MTTGLMPGVSVAGPRGEARHQAAARLQIRVLNGLGNGLVWNQL